MTLQDHTKQQLKAATVALTAGAVGAAVAYRGAHVEFTLPLSTTDSFAVGFAAAVAAAAAWAHYSIDYDPSDIIKVDIDEPIRREQKSSPLEDADDADAIVEAIEAADENPYSDSLLVEINTPGGEIVPSEDIRRAVRDFDGPTAAYATDTCASGGYLVASACDHIVAREGAMVGSIGVLGSQVNVSDLADELGVQYERYTAGEYKDAGTPLKDPDDHEREHIQGLIDTHYDTFVRRVAEGRPLSEDEIRETEARVYLGPDAADAGLVDEVGDEETAREWLSEQIETEPDGLEVLQYEPQSGSMFDTTSPVHKAMFSLGVGISDRFAASIDVEDWVSRIKLR